jgi:hypothetical protein
VVARTGALSPPSRLPPERALLLAATAPIQLDSTALASVGNPIARELIPGWTVTWIPVSREQIDQLIPGALAVCRPDKDAMPTRSLATVYVLTPWPPNEDLAETLWHELTHALMSDLVQLIPDRDTAAGVLVEEKVVERLGKLLAKIPIAARRAIRSAVEGLTLPAPLRARISAATQSMAPRMSARGGTMDPKLIMEALDALIAGDAAKCQEILKGIIASMAGAEATETAEAQPGMATLGTGENMATNAAPVVAPEEQARSAARQTAADTETLRARKEAQEAATELKLIADDQRTSAKETLIVGLRARLGAKLTPAAEKRILAAPTYQQAKELAAFAEELGGGSTQRARSGVQIEPAPGNTVGALQVGDLLKAGLPEALANEIAELSKTDPELAAHSFSRARARLQTAPNPWMPPPAPKGN